MTFAHQKLLGLMLVSLTLVTSLTACFPIIVGGAVVGTMVVVDRRTSGAQLDDQNIELRTSSRVSEKLGNRTHVNVTSYNRRVLLTGEVPNPQDSQMVEQIAASVESVQSVVNELAVMGNTSLSQRSNDTWLTGRVKAALLDAKDLNVNAFKVVTERGIVYLMGRVTQREAERASEIARSISGVQKVVRVFEIISEEELRALSPPPAPPPKSSP
ncbi:BON domain-containing protein [Rhodoferax sp.]|uniref:BON domain-containing protein n=1 Tax=Rhodoferax sp. TaxID=50421 RepID=UPI0025DFE648|nr:BON domain-containing protein [Rhodoferax sp.]